jgi:carboxypeptidase family protein
MRAMNALTLILLCLAPAQVAVAQTVAKENAESANQARRYGVIAGRLVNDAGRPVAGAPVQVFKVGVKVSGRTQVSVTDDEGQFKATGLDPGSYMISAYVPGYVAQRTDSERDYHRPGENITINLIKGGVITGRVTDPFGEPMVGVRVEAVKVRELEGVQKYSGVFQRRNSSLTDDRGVYRMYGLEPGVYVAGASSDLSGFDISFYAGRDAMTWHPSSPRATAAEITVRSGEEAPGIDIRHREERGYTISGTIAGDAASDLKSGDISLILTSGADRQLVGLGTVYRMKSFAVSGVPDGEYEMVAFRANYNEPAFASSAPRRVVVKGADVSGIALKIEPPTSISGKVKIESSSIGKNPCEDAAQAKDRATIEDVLLSAAPENESRTSIESIAPYFRYLRGVMGGAPDEKGEFTLGGLAVGRFRIKADLPDESWYIRAVTQPASGAAKKPIDAYRNGIAIKSGEKLSGVEVVIAQGAASLNGRVVPANGGSILPSRLRVHLIPAEVPAADDVLRYAETAVRGDGSFEFKHIAPGKYLLHTRQATEKEANDDQVRQVAWDAAERAKLRREATAAKNEIELKLCERMKDHKLIYEAR